MRVEHTHQSITSALVFVLVFHEYEIECKQNMESKSTNETDVRPPSPNPLESLGQTICTTNGSRDIVFG